jgi:hypothetical protein
VQSDSPPPINEARQIKSKLLQVNLDDFVDIIGRNFKQPKEGLGLDNSPSAHMWRTMMWPTRFL